MLSNAIKGNKEMQSKEKACNVVLETLNVSPKLWGVNLLRGHITEYRGPKFEAACRI